MPQVHCWADESAHQSCLRSWVQGSTIPMAQKRGQPECQWLLTFWGASILEKSTPLKTSEPMWNQRLHSLDPTLHTGSGKSWLLAKSWVRNSDFQLHELQYHLLNTHLVAEVIAVATMRCLPGLHPVFKVQALPSVSFLLDPKDNAAAKNIHTAVCDRW